MARLVLAKPCFSWETNREERDNHWHQDLQLLARELPNKCKPLENAHKKHAFLSRLDYLDKKIDSRTDEQMLVGIMQSLAVIGDSHTSLAFDSFLLPFYPMKLYSFKEGMYVIRAGEQCPEVLGARLLNVDQTSADHVLRRLKTLLGHENPWVFKALAPYLIISAKILNGSGFAHQPAQAHFEFLTHDGTHRRVVLNAGSRMGKATFFTDRLLRWSNPDKDYWFQFLPDQKAMYFCYRHCEEMPDLPFADFQRQLLDAIRANRCERLIIDLRDNGGGNSAVLEPLITALLKENFSNGALPVFALIGPGTLSSAAMNAIDLKGKIAALLVGEPAGTNPNHYGELKELELPNSHLVIQYSTNYFHPWPKNLGRSLDPQIRVAETWKDFEAGKDTALNAALHAPLPQIIRVD
jgi:hypothetical protein